MPKIEFGLMLLGPDEPAQFPREFVVGLGQFRRPAVPRQRRGALAHRNAFQRLLAQPASYVRGGCGLVEGFGGSEDQRVACISTIAPAVARQFFHPPRHLTQPRTVDRGASQQCGANRLGRPSAQRELTRLVKQADDELPGALVTSHRITARLRAGALSTKRRYALSWRGICPAPA